MVRGRRVCCVARIMFHVTGVVSSVAGMAFCVAGVYLCGRRGARGLRGILRGRSLREQRDGTTCLVLLAWFCGRFSRPQCGTAFGWRATPRTVAWVAVRALQVAAAGVTFAAAAVRTDTPPWTPCMQVLFVARGPSDLGPQRCPSRTSLFSLVPNSGFSMRASNSAIVTLCQQPAPCCSFQPCLSSFWPPPHRILVSAPGRFPAD